MTNSLSMFITIFVGVATFSFAAKPSQAIRPSKTETHNNPYITQSNNINSRNKITVELPIRIKHHITLSKCHIQDILVNHQLSPSFVESSFPTKWAVDVYSIASLTATTNEKSTPLKQQDYIFYETRELSFDDITSSPLTYSSRDDTLDTFNKSYPFMHSIINQSTLKFNVTIRELSKPEHRLSQKEQLHRYGPTYYKNLNENTIIVFSQLSKITSENATSKHYHHEIIDRKMRIMKLDGNIKSLVVQFDHEEQIILDHYCDNLISDDGIPKDKKVGDLENVLVVQRLVQLWIRLLCTISISLFCLILYLGRDFILHLYHDISMNQFEVQMTLNQSDLVKVETEENLKTLLNHRSSLKRTSMIVIDDTDDDIDNEDDGGLLCHLHKDGMSVPPVVRRKYDPNLFPPSECSDNQRRSLISNCSNSTSLFFLQNQNGEDTTALDHSKQSNKQLINDDDKACGGNKHNHDNKYNGLYEHRHNIEDKKDPHRILLNVSNNDITEQRDYKTEPSKSFDLFNPHSNLLASQGSVEVEDNNSLESRRNIRELHQDTPESFNLSNHDSCSNHDHNDETTTHSNLSHKDGEGDRTVTERDTHARTLMSDGNIGDNCMVDEVLMYLDERRMALISPQCFSNEKKIPFIPPRPAPIFQPSSELLSASKAVQSPVWEFEKSSTSKAEKSVKTDISDREKRQKGPQKPMASPHSKAKIQSKNSNKKRSRTRMGPRTKATHDILSASSGSNCIPRTILVNPTVTDCHYDRHSSQTQKEYLNESKRKRTIDDGSQNDSNGSLSKRSRSY